MNKLALSSLIAFVSLFSCTAETPNQSITHEPITAFSLTWGVGFDSSYDSETHLLVKAKRTIERDPSEYITDYVFPNLESMLAKIEAINPYSYPSSFNAYEGSTLATMPSTNYRLSIGSKEIESRNCPFFKGYPDGIKEAGKKYLEVVFEIIQTIENSDEWKALPPYEVLYE